MKRTAQKIVLALFVLLPDMAFACVHDKPTTTFGAVLDFLGSSAYFFEGIFKIVGTVSFVAIMWFAWNICWFKVRRENVPRYVWKRLIIGIFVLAFYLLDVALVLLTSTFCV